MSPATALQALARPLRLPAVQGLTRQLKVSTRMARSLAFALAWQPVLFLVTGMPFRSRAAERALSVRLRSLFAEDRRDIEEGTLPPDIDAMPWRAYAEAAPGFILDLPRVWMRARRQRIDEVPRIAARFPRYYARNFHFQTEGYLGHTSARLYDLQVEVLFGGTADAMRRRMLPPLVRFARQQGMGPERPMRVLDVACGTGHLLGMMGKALPGAQLFGVDLSPHYIAYARAGLPRELDVSLVCENAERLPFLDGHFDAVTCIYLLHELPTDVRRRVLAEMARVVRPGGLVVLGDSAQPGDAPDLAEVLEQFPRHYHEPYYLSYLREDIPARLGEVGLEVFERRPAFLTTVTVARKPLRS
jgi:ubiquinone/menaquinone biosynthesis C-methylase UbiE